MARRQSLETQFGEWAGRFPGLDLPSTVAAVLVFAAGSLGVRLCEQTAARHGLSFNDFQVLAAIRSVGDGNGIRPGTIARIVSISPPAITGRLDHLEQAGLVVRALDPDDRRGWRVSLTDEGSRRTDAAFVDLNQLHAEIFSPLTPAERTTFIRLLDRVVQRMETGEDPPG